MNIRTPLFKVRSLTTGSFLGAFFGSLLLMVSTAPAASFDDQLKRVELKLSLIKMDVLRLYQSGPLGTGRSSLRSSGRPSGSSVSGREDQKPPVPQSPVPLQGVVGLQEIAALMKRLEAAEDPAAPSKGTGPLPTDELRLLLADYLLQANLISQAEPILKDLTTRTLREPIAAEAWYRLEKLYYRKRDYQQALGAFFKIPDNSELPLRLEATYLAGNSYLYLKDYQKAIEWLAKVGQGNDFYPFALYSSGLAYLNRGDAESSVQAQFQKLIALNPGEDSVLQELINKARVTLGFLLIDQKRFLEAVGSFDSVPPHSRYRAQARSGIGRAYLGMDGCVKAIVIFRDLIEQTPTHPYALEAHLPVGNCYSKLNAFRRAVESYQGALQTYAARKENLKKLIERVQTTDPGRWFLKPEAVPIEKKSVLVASSPELAIEQDYPDVMDLYSDWSRLEEQIARQTRPTKGSKTSVPDPADESVWEPIQNRIRDGRRYLDELLRTAATDQLLTKIKLIDDLVVRANVGIAKNTILMQDYGTAP
jgi:tetratricopeptide (TPR) repeat protein